MQLAFVFGLFAIAPAVLGAPILTKDMAAPVLLTGRDAAPIEKVSSMILAYNDDLSVPESADVTPRAAVASDKVLSMILAYNDDLSEADK
ncbi:Bcpic4 [Botrytis cinerea B05.10]|uniref:Bcpic4 n=3 Tax=Botryotinia fuckeliana TaxID=40559 RepID=A0A384J850_BOTFB|nr:Bcpic4 [Botrytis cinerea B05.10]ATZ46703.1 Bcpic4 [Botrytis cinerea B05.10]EMR84855.1 hypothetical protein BcDW1_6469 [Botrytis cinerea BcDW1]CCD48383.1 BcPIC4 [Botrytis cinerea T4]